MIRDRGNIKWTSLMLPEHVKLLKKYNEELKKVEQPIIDDHKYEEFNEEISQAIRNNEALVFTYYENGKTEEYNGYIEKIDYITKEIQIKNASSKSCILKLDNIIEIE